MPAITNITDKEFLDYRQEVLEFVTLRHGYEFYAAKGLIFTEGCDDLHYYMVAYCRLPSERRLSLMARHRHPNFSGKVGMIAPAGDPNPIELLDEFLACLKEDRGLVEWLSPWLTNEPRWVILLQDLLGRSFVIENCWAEDLAKGHLDYLRGKYPERQYRIEKRDPIPDRGANGSPE